MIVTTTPSIEGKQLTQYIGVVTAQTFIGASFFKDLIAGLRDLFVRRPGTYEKVLEEAKQYAIHDLIQKAKSMGANAIVCEFDLVAPQGGPRCFGRSHLNLF